MALGSKIYRGIGVTLALLAGIGLVISSIPLSLFTPTTTPPSQNFAADFPANFQFEIASSSDARTQGLSGRADVPSNYGMLFVFPESGSYGFWMHEMLVPIDIIWINEAGIIVDIDADVSPDTYPETFYPALPVRYVLETRAGESAILGLSIGDQVPLPI